MTFRQPFTAGTNNFAISIWLQPTSNDANYHGFMGNDQGARRSPCLWVISNGLHYDSYDGTTRVAGIVDNYFTQNVWVHVVWVRVGSQFLFYKNGDYHDTVPGGASSYRAENYWLGRVDNYYHGRLDEVAFFSHDLDANDARQLYCDPCTVPGTYRCASTPRAACCATDRTVRFCVHK